MRERPREACQQETSRSDAGGMSGFSMVWDLACKTFAPGVGRKISLQYGKRQRSTYTSMQTPVKSGISRLAQWNVFTSFRKIRRRMILSAATYGALHHDSTFERRAMPVSVTNSRAIYDALKECDIRLVSALPETWLVHLNPGGRRRPGNDPGASGKRGGGRWCFRRSAFRRSKVGHADAESRIPGFHQWHRLFRPSV